MFFHSAKGVELFDNRVIGRKCRRQNPLSDCFANFLLQYKVENVYGIRLNQLRLVPSRKSF